MTSPTRSWEISSSHSATSAWPRARCATGREAYATSRSRACLNANSTCPARLDVWRARTRPRCLQGGERVGDVVAETAAQRLDPEHPAHHRRRLQQPLLGYRQRVDARGQQRVEGVRQRAGPALGHVRDQLLEEVRVAFRPREDLLAALGVEGRRRAAGCRADPGWPAR